MDRQSTTYAPTNSVNQENVIGGDSMTLGCDSSSMVPLQSTNRGNICQEAKQVREKFMKYFMGEGHVPGQSNHILKNK